MTNIFQKLSFVVTTTVLSLSVINANPINAASITYDFEVNVSTGSLLGDTYSGSFEFDDSTLTDVGEESLSVSELSFNLLGVNFTEASFFNPVLARFDDGDFSGLNFAETVDGSFFLQLNEGDFTYLTLPNGSLSRGEITYTNTTTIPEPTAVFSLLALGAIGSIRILKKGR